jgi:release factor glutamine methyltransferase
VSTDIWTVRKLLEWTEKHFREKGIESPRLDAQILLAHAMGCQKIELYVRHEEQPTEPQRTKFREAIKKRAEGMPVAYLVGYREFFSLTFQVSPAVLIPRPDTETLVVEALRYLKPIASPRVLDLGTGSGCIAIAIAKNHPGCRVDAVEIDAEAANIARANAEKMGVADRVTVHVGDLFAPLAHREYYDVIASNPPYITPTEYDALDKTVRDYEPKGALVGGADGLEFYRRIIRASANYLVSNGRLMLEVGIQQGETVAQLSQTESRLVFEKIYSDLNRIPRAVVFQRAME